MKEYNRRTKRWEEKEKIGSLKKRETCKGGKEHEWVLMIPKYISRTHNLSKEEIREYYKIEQDRIDFETTLADRCAKIGVKGRYWIGGNSKFYMCAICKKEKYEEANKV